MVKISNFSAFFVTIIFIFILYAGCDWINPEEPIPSYIKIEKIAFQANAQQGGATSKITDAWVFVDNQLLGGFELPTTIPVLKSGQQEISVFAGVHENGIRSTPDIYPFYEKYKVVANLEPTATTVIQPSVAYSSSAVFAFIEDFETANRFAVDLDEDDFTEIDRTTDEVKYGSRAGRAILTADHPYLEVTTNLYYNVGDIGQSVYLELDYKNDVVFQVGLQAEVGNDEIKLFKLYLSEQNDWNKIYISLNEEVGMLFGERYRVIFKAELPSNKDIATIYLDNIKLIHF